MLSPKLDWAVNTLKAYKQEVTEEEVQAACADPNAFNSLIDKAQTLESQNANKKFNLKKAQQFAPAAPTDPFGAEQTPEGYGLEQQYIGGGEAVVEPHFNTAVELMTWMDSVDGSTAFNTLSTDIPDNQEAVLDDGRTTVNARSHLKDALEAYYDPMLENDPGAAREREKAANQVMQVLPHTESGIEAPYTTYESEMYKKIIESSNNEIKRKAEKIVQKSKGFNLSKTAQHKSVENAFLWGPEEKRFDPFYRQPVSDWHIVERNKGFGLTVDDVWNIDWEAIWRGTVMDKYSRPYRDKEGNWVGGYIQKRFEVDKWIPETSNMQLKPGQKRKPRPPEYGVLESRLQANRAEDNRGYGPVSDTSKPFNWLEASKNGSTKTAIALPGNGSVGLEEKMPPDIEQEIETELDIMDEPTTALDNMSPKQFGRALYDMWKENPASININEVFDQRVKDSFQAAYLTNRMVASDIPNITKESVKKKVS